MTIHIAGQGALGTSLSCYSCGQLNSDFSQIKGEAPEKISQSVTSGDDKKVLAIYPHYSVDKSSMLTRLFMFQIVSAATRQDWFSVELEKCVSHTNNIINMLQVRITLINSLHELLLKMLVLCRYSIDPVTLLWISVTSDNVESQLSVFSLRNSSPDHHWSSSPATDTIIIMMTDSSFKSVQMIQKVNSNGSKIWKNSE